MPANEALSLPFLRLYALALLFFGANAMLNVILPLRSGEIGASNSQIGFIMGAYMFACMVFRPWAGHLIRKRGPVVVLRVLLVVNGLALALYAASGLEAYFAARVMQGICTAFFSMALQTGIIDALPEERRSQGLSLYSLFTYMPSIVGPLMAIGIWEWGGMNAFAGAMIVFALATGIFGYAVPLHAARPDAERRTDKRDAPNGRAGRRPLLVCGALMLIASVVFGAVTTFVPLYAGQIRFGHAGVFLTMQAIAVVAVRLLYSSRIPSDGRWHRRFVGAVCLLAAIGASLLSLAPAWGPVAFYAAAVLIGLAQALLYPTLVSYLTFVLPDVSRNVRLGLFIGTADLGVAMGGMAMGPVADRLSYSAMYATGAGLAFVAVCAALLGPHAGRSGTRSEAG